MSDKLGIHYDTSWARRQPAIAIRKSIIAVVTRPIVRFFAKPTVYGLDRVNSLNGPTVFASNHASHIDTSLIITSLPSRFAGRLVVAAAADYFFDKKWKAALWSLLINAVPIERQKVNRASADAIAGLVRDEWSVLIFPEGGRSPDGYMQPFRGGAAYLAIRCGVPVVPIYLAGTRDVLPKDGKRIRRSATTVTFGAPIIPQDGDKAHKLSERIENAVKVLADESSSDWWSAQQRSILGQSPELRGPDESVSRWRRTWQLADRAKPKRLSRVGRTSNQ